MLRSNAHTTRILHGIAYLWMSFPLSYVLYAAVALSLDMAGLVKLVLSPWYWIVGAAAAAAGYGIYRIRWYGWYAFLFSNGLITYQTALALAHYSEADWRFKLGAFVATTAGQLLATFLVGREVRVPYFFPRIRWWESDPRYKLSVAARLARPDGTEMEGEIMDISLGGCFVKTHHYFQPEERLSLDFTLFESPVRCSGKVVWRTESTVTHPKGIGVKFDPLPKPVLVCIRKATRKLRKLARVYSQLSRERNWQEYLQREQRYQGKTPSKGKP